MSRAGCTTRSSRHVRHHRGTHGVGHIGGGSGDRLHPHIVADVIGAARPSSTGQGAPTDGQTLGATRLDGARQARVAASPRSMSVRRRSRRTRAGVAAMVGVLAIVVDGAVVGPARGAGRTPPRHTRAGDRHPAAVGDRPVGGGRRHAPRALRAGAQPRADDPRRHQHLGAARARLDARPWSSTPGRSTRGTSPPCCASSRSAAPGWPRRCSPTGTTTMPRRPRASPSSPAPGSARWVAATTTLATATSLTTGGLELRVVATPGHTSDSISFALPADHALLTGDTVLGRGTTVVAHPDGELAAYLDSLERIRCAHRRRLGGLDPARPRAGRAGCRRDGRVLPRPPRGAARPGAPGARRRRGGRGRTRWRECCGGSTPRCRQRCGRRRGCRSAPSWSTCRAEPGGRRGRRGGSERVSGRGGAAARRRGAAPRGPRGAASRARRSRPAPCSPSRGRRRPAGRAPPG